MNKIIYIFFIMAVLTSCAESYTIQGSSSVSSLDGSKLYLKTVKDQELKNMDSCDVVHGKFRFTGLLDTIRLASLYMDDQSLAMPVVVESGEIEIHIDNTGRSVTGSPLNEKLYQFIKRHDQIDNEMNELSHKQSQMLLEGIDENVINRQLSAEAAPPGTAGRLAGDELHRRKLRQRAGTWRLYDDDQQLSLSRADSADRGYHEQGLEEIQG